VGPLVGHEPALRLPHGPPLLAEAVVHGTHAAQVRGAAQATQECDRLGALRGQEASPVSARVGGRRHRVVSNALRVVVGLPVRDVGEHRTRRAPVRPGGEAAVGRIPVQRRFRRGLEVGEQVGPRGSEERHREVDLLRRRRLEVGREQDLVARTPARDLDARSGAAAPEREAVPGAPGSVLRDLRGELREELRLALGPGREAEQLQAEGDHPRLAVVAFVQPDSDRRSPPAWFGLRAAAGACAFRGPRC